MARPLFHPVDRPKPPAPDLADVLRDVLASELVGPLRELFDAVLVVVSRPQPAPVVSVPAPVVNVPAPVVNVEPPVVTVTPPVVQPPAPVDLSPLLDKLGQKVTLDDAALDALKKAVGTRVVGGSQVREVRVQNASNQPIDPASEETLKRVERGLTDYETRLDYDTRTDGNPVYVGKALNGTATSATGWLVQKLGYDASNRLTRAQVVAGTWDGRASLGWT